MSGETTPRPRRRAGDSAVVLFSGARTADEAIALDLPAFQATPEQMEEAAFLIDLGGEEALLLPGWDAQFLPRGEGGEELEARAVTVALALRRERSWLKRRLAMPDFLLRYTDALQAATVEPEAYDALRQVAKPVVGAYHALVFMAVTQGADDPLHMMGDPALPFHLDPLPGEAVRRLPESRIVTRDDLETGADPALLPMASLLGPTGSAQLCYAPVGPDALLVLLERRAGRVYTGEDRALLDALLRQAESAVRRIQRERPAPSAFIP